MGLFIFTGLFANIPLEINKHGYYYNTQFSKTLGLNSFSKIDDYTRVSNYITKYITKYCIKNANNQIYLRSKGLIFATKEEINPIELGSKWFSSNDFVSYYDFNLKNNSDFDRDLIKAIVFNNKDKKFF